MDDARAPVTGNPGVDDALAGLLTLEDLPVEEHVARFESVLDSLRGSLGASLGSPVDPGATSPS